MNNKENQDDEAPASELGVSVVASPKVSGSAASEDPSRAEQSFADAQAYEMSPGHDHLHWGGVGQSGSRLPHDARSVASSAAAERDDKSLYEDPGALDATEEGEEHEDGDEEEEEPEEITLTQVQCEMRGMQLRSENSNAESGFTATPGGGSLADVVDQLADQAVSGELSPRQAAAAIRSATRVAAGGSRGEDGGGSPTGGGGAPGMAEMEGSMEMEGSVSVSGAGRWSVAQSEDGWQGTAGGGGGGGGSMGDLAMESVALEAEPAAAAAAVGAAAQEQQHTAAAGHDRVNPFLAADAAAAVPAADSPLAAAGSAGTNNFLAGDPPAAAAALAAAPAVHRSPSNYQSRLMQQLTATTSEDDLTVYSADAAGVVTLEAVAEPPQQQQEVQPAAAIPVAAAAAIPAAAAAAGRPARMEPLSVENGSASGSGGSSGAMPTAATSAALAAINATGSNQQEQGPAPLFPQEWYQMFKGLLYMDGVDALGRPVVVLNADSVPPNMKSSALVYVKAHLEPLVNQGDYVLVFTSRGATKLPSMWIMGAYRSLPRPFRKHVQYIVLVRPSAFLRTVMAFMRPFVSKKAHRKIKLVQSVHEIAEATGGEVTLPSLGPAFSADQAAAEEHAQHGGMDASP